MKFADAKKIGSESFAGGQQICSIEIEIARRVGQNLKLKNLYVLPQENNSYRSLNADELIDFFSYEIELLKIDELTDLFAARACNFYPAKNHFHIVDEKSFICWDSQFPLLLLQEKSPKIG